MDEATIAAAKQGSREAQARLLRQLQDPWYRLCLSLLRDSDLALEATQETALRFLRRLPTFRGESLLQTWSFGIALNVVREMRRSTRQTVEMDEQPDLPASSDTAPLICAEQAENLEILHVTLADLPQRQREVVVLRYFEDLSTQQTAQVMNCAAGTVKATLHQAFRNLRQRLAHLVL